MSDYRTRRSGRGNRSLCPEGQHKGVILACEPGTSQAGNAKLTLTVEVTTDAKKKYRIWWHVSLESGWMDDICDCFGEGIEPRELEGLTALFSVGHEEWDGHDTQAKIITVEACGDRIPRRNYPGDVERTPIAKVDDDCPF